MLKSKLLQAGVAVLLSLICQSVAWSQTDKEVESAREKGVAYLKSQQTKEGNWEYDEDLTKDTHNVGVTALCTLALIENGVSHNDDVIRKGYQFVIRNSGNLTNTYDLALSVVLLSRMGDRRDRSRIKALAARLVAGQLKSGGWSYTCPLAEPDVLREPRKLVFKEGVGDNSCTQFAVLGLWVASRSNVDIEYTLSGVAQRFVQYQKSDGGWDYKLDEEAGSSASMTGAGLFCLAVAQANRIRSGKKPAATVTPVVTPGEEARPVVDDPPVKSLMEHPIFSKGLKRTGDFVQGIRPGTAKYFLWSVERIGVLLGLEELGGTNWFNKGADSLIKTQQEDGSWVEAEKTLAPTSFAILFLRKANLGSDISRLLEGESDLKFQLFNRPDQPRFKTFEEALKAAAPGDTMRIDSNGPIVVKNLELDKDLTIQAGYGYTPVFNFELGVDRLGIRLRPDREPKARNCINIINGNVTFEGLDFQFDPPTQKTKVDWGGVAVLGGSLKMLNCTISEGTRQGMASIVMAAPGKLIVRNCLLVGGRAGVEVIANGKQEVLLHNTVLYNQNGVQVVNDAKTKKPADVTVTLNQVSLQASNAFSCPNLVGKVSILSERSAYRCDAMGMDFLATSSSAKNREFQGNKNIYDVRAWLGAKGSANSTVKDAKTWNTFWGGKDTDSFARIATFVVSRQNGSFSHDLNVQDWQVELPQSAEAPLQNANIGVDTFLAGIGGGYDQYRETIEYSNWLKGNLDLETELATTSN